MRKPSLDIKIFQERRQRLASQIPGAALVVAAHPHYLRNDDVHYDYRQDTNLFYLTGYEEPNCVLVFRPGQTPETVMFVLEKDPVRETWDGFLFGPEGAKAAFGFDQCYTIDKLDAVLPDLLGPVDRVYYRIGRQEKFDKAFLKALESARAKQGRSGLGLKPVVDPQEVLGEMRLFKRPEEIEWLKKACEITAEGHLDAMKFVKPGVNERQVEATIRHSFMMNMSARLGYNCIVATGSGATTLHYVFNDQVCQDGQLILIDAGAEWNYFTGDITRTFPVNGRFTDAQRKFYSCVLSVQKHILSIIQPGLAFKELQTTAVRLLTEAMVELSLLKGSVDTLVETLAYKKYYPHGVSHWLGMDVHDCGSYMLKGESRKLAPGMAFTVEPGLYVPENDESAPAEFRGLGVRIEDDIFVTTTGHYNMTAKAPKEIVDLESL